MAGSDGGNDITATGKYLLVAVPNFGDDPISGRPMTSYLRLGAASTKWEQDAGGDLASKISEAGPTGGRLSPDAVPVSPVGDATRPVFVDDLRNREGCPDPHGLSVAQRVEQSSVLHTRGGWRDHSDGNRISTTYGDKVEIIRGNYKLVVLGRQDTDFSKSTGMDLSGQHFNTFAYTNPSLIRVEWTQDLGGTWHVQETSEGVVHSVNFAGDEYTFRWGEHFETTTGLDPAQPAQTGPGIGPRVNPHIIEKTWAMQIESYTGCAASRIPSIHEETWAIETFSVTDVTSATETTTAGSITETTTVSGAITSETTAGTISGSTTAGATAESTIVGAASETTLAGATNSMTLVGAANTMTTAGVTFTGDLVGVEASLKILGESLSLLGGVALQDVKLLGLLNETVIAGGKLSTTYALYNMSYSSGTKVDVHMGKRFEFYTDDSVELSGANNYIGAYMRWYL